MQAIGELAKDPNGFPDLNDRAPSLVNWISRDLDESVRRLLGRAARNGESVIVDESVRLAHDPARKARWERAWRIVEHTGLVLKVTVHVSEDNDSSCTSASAPRWSPTACRPWIARRREGQEVEAAIDISQRQLFYRFLEENISAAVLRFRARGDRAPWGTLAAQTATGAVSAPRMPSRRCEQRPTIDPSGATPQSGGRSAASASSSAQRAGSVEIVVEALQEPPLVRLGAPAVEPGAGARSPP